MNPLCQGLIVLSLLCTAPKEIPAVTQNREALIAHVRENEVIFTVSNKYRPNKEMLMGAGVLWDTTGVVVTVEHVFTHSQIFHIPFSPKPHRIFTINPLRINPDRDIAIVKISDLTLSETRGALPLGEPHINDSVIIVCPEIHIPEIIEGRVTELGVALLKIKNPWRKREMMQLNNLTAIAIYTLTQAGGCSGSPVVNLEGELIGIVESSDFYKKLVYIIPVEDIIAEINEVSTR